MDISGTMSIITKTSCLFKLHSYFYKGNKQFGVYRDLKSIKWVSGLCEDSNHLFSLWPMANIGGYVHKWDIGFGNAPGKSRRMKSSRNYFIPLMWWNWWLQDWISGNAMWWHLTESLSQGNKYTVFTQFQEIAWAVQGMRGIFLLQKSACCSLPADVFIHCCESWFLKQCVW